MALALSTADRAFLRRKTLMLRLLAEFRLSAGTVRATDHTDALVWGGHTWTGMGQIATVSSRNFAGGFSFSGLSITINGAGLATPDDPSGATLLATILNDAAPLDPVIVKLWTGDPATGEVGPCLPFFSGVLSRAPLTRTPGGPASMTLEIEGDDILLNRTAGRVRSDADQRRMWPVGGGGFHMVAQATGQAGIVYWGSEAPAATVSAGGGGSNVWRTAANNVLAGER